MRLADKKYWINAIIFSIMICVQHSTADQLKSFNNTRDVKGIVCVEEVIWSATSGGLTGFQIENEQFSTYNHLDGIAGTGLTLMNSDNNGNIWIVVENRNLQLFNIERRMITQTVFSGSEISSINDIAICDRGIYLATNLGVGRLKYFPEQEAWFWFEQYTKLGDFPAQENAACVAIKADRIWVGTDKGVASAELSDHIPLNWTNYSLMNGLSGNDVMDIAIVDDKIYIATNGGISIWDGNAWGKTGVPDDLKRLYNYNGSLYAVARNGIFTWTGSTWRQISNDQKWFSSMTIDDDGDIWAGLLQNEFSAGGIAVANDTGWVEYNPDSPVSNVINDIAVTDDGRVILVGGRGGGQYGLSIWNGSYWQLFHKPVRNNRIFGYPHKSVTIDLDGNFWFGSRGGGLGYIRLQSDGYLDTLIVYDHSANTGQRLIGFDNDRHINYVLASGVEKDSQGNIWVVNRGAADGNVLVCIPRSFVQSPDTSSWVYFNSSNFSNFKNMDLIAIDGLDRKWLATTSTSELGRGVYVFDDNGTLDNYNDDKSWGPIQGLGQPQANCIEWDPNGYIWVGAIDGAYYINANSQNPENESFSAYYNTRDESVNAIEIDANGNKWLGTNHGIMIIGQDLYTIIDRITTDPPHLLPDSTITAITIDSQSGWAYIGTTNGTIGIRTPYRDFGENIDEVVVVPNPFNPNLSPMYFTEGLAGDSDVRIYTPDGRLVRRLSNREAGQGWDGLDDNGRKVADGVYLLLTYNSKGQAGQGKVAVVWK